MTPQTKLENGQDTFKKMFATEKKEKDFYFFLKKRMALEYGGESMNDLLLDPLNFVDSVKTQQQEKGDKEIQQECELRFKKMKVEICTMQTKIHNLESLLVKMKEMGDAFDEEDIMIIQKNIEKSNLQLQKMIQEYKTRVGYYQSVVISMKQNLDNRQNILESFDKEYGILKDQELFNFFVKKQADLKKLHGDICSHLTH